MAHATLTNATFESPAQNLGGYTVGGIDGWTKSSGDAGVWHIPAGGFFAANAPEGLQIGYSNALLVAQQSTDVLGLGTSTLSAMGGRRTDGFAGSFTMRLWAGGTVAAGDIIGGTLLGEVTYDYTKESPSTFSLVKIEYTANDGDASLGKLLTVQFQKVAGSQMNFDDVQLKAQSVPEPFTCTVLGSLALLAARRRKA